MRKCTLAIALAAVGCFAAAQPAYAFLTSGDIIQLGNGPGGPGGIFYVTEPGDLTTNFLTFCSHFDEQNILFNTDLKAVISEFTDPDDLPVTPQAAWLYTQFLRQSNVLTGFDYSLLTPASNNNPTAKNQARALQLGIWLGMGFSETEIRGIEDFNGDEWTSSYINQLKTQYLDGWLANFTASGWGQTNHIGAIKILNLYSRDSRTGEYTRHIQDQLIEIRVIPEPGVAAMLSAVGLALAMRRRRRRRS